MPAPRLVSDRQLELLVEFLEKNPALAVGRRQNEVPQRKQFTSRRWQELAEMLNSLGEGAKKTWIKWRDYWQDRKYVLRKKTEHMKLDGIKTEGPPPRKCQLTLIEKRMLAILDSVGVSTFKESSLSSVSNTATDTTLRVSSEPAASARVQWVKRVLVTSEPRHRLVSQRARDIEVSRLQTMERMAAAQEQIVMELKNIAGIMAATQHSVTNIEAALCPEPLL